MIKRFWEFIEKKQSRSVSLEELGKNVVKIFNIKKIFEFKYEYEDFVVTVRKVRKSELNENEILLPQKCKEHTDCLLCKDCSHYRHDHPIMSCDMCLCGKFH